MRCRSCSTFHVPAVALPGPIHGDTPGTDILRIALPNDPKNEEDGFEISGGLAAWKVKNTVHERYGRARARAMLGEDSVQLRPSRSAATNLR